VTLTWDLQDFTPSPKDVEGLAANQKLVFLGKVQDFGEPLSAAQAEKMGDVYGFLSSQNVELKAAYFHIALQSKVTSTYPLVAQLLGEVGRMKFVRPLFRSLNKVDRELALKTFEKNKDFYHPICRAMVEKDLGVAAEAK
jgi:leukotriene-A4 hydrolase